MPSYIQKASIVFALGAVCAIGFAVTSRAFVAAPPVEELVSHKALYDLKMTSVQSGAGIAGVEGQMYYEQSDDCDAWTSEHRFTVDYIYPERGASTTTSHYVSWEGKDAKQFYFNSTREEGGREPEQLRGTMNVNDDGSASADYGRPEGLSYKLAPGYFLPMAHTLAVVQHARAGDKLFNAIVFDGTDADGPVEINTFIGKKAAPAEMDAIAAANPKIDKTLLMGDAWHVRMSYFPVKDDESATPAYEMDMILHANGVVSDVLVDYKSFKVRQSLSALEKIPHRKC